MAGSNCTYAIKYDGSLASIGDGSYGRLGHGDSENENSLRLVGTLQGKVGGGACLHTCMPGYIHICSISKCVQVH